jgi:hypothetical protein
MRKEQPMRLPSTAKTKIYGVRASMADLARSFAVLASLAVSSDWFFIDTEKLAAARRKKR